MARAYVGVGSNIDPLANIPAALARLAGIVEVRAVSTFYRTPPLGVPGPEFVNGVVEIDTAMPPRDLKLAVLRRIEGELGRVRTADRNAPRAIDLDLVLYDDLVVSEGDLLIPDPDIEQRAFLALPLLEMAPELALPGTGRAIRDVAHDLDAGGIVALPAFTASLRAQLAPEHPPIRATRQQRKEDPNEPR